MNILSNSNLFWPSRNSDEVPVWIASHSPISKFDLDRTIQLFEKYEAAGVALLVTGAIILDCNDKIIKGPIIRLKANRDNAKNPIGFHLFGPAEPNLLPASVGIDLCRAAVKSCRLPIVANIGYFEQATNKSSIDNLKKIIDTGISTFEVSLSCPTLKQQGHPATWWAVNFQFIEEIRKYSSLPIALKIGHQNLKDIDFRILFKFCEWYKITQLTTMDSIKLACPPNIGNNGEVYPPFSNFPDLCRVGSHGPWNKFLLYDNIATLKKSRDMYSGSEVKISAVGGVMSAEQVFEAMSLGADSVQLSSSVFWDGIESAKKIISETKDKIKRFNTSLQLSSFAIDESPKDGLERVYGKDYLDQWNANNDISATNLEKCIGCKLCCDTPCLARVFKDKLPLLTESLCSGCSWCKQICPAGAIHMKQCRGQND